MKILALDSSGLVASVAVVEEENMIAEYTVNYKKTHSQTLLPMLDEIVKMIELDLKTIDAIAIASGPGSFTGLRIGSATAKGLALALKKPIISIPTVEGLAYNLYGTDKIICPIMDARRNQVYTATYRFENNELITVHEPAAMEITELLDSFGENEEVIFAGDGVSVFKEVITDNMGNRAHFAPPHLILQDASSAAVYAAHLYEKGIVVNAVEFAPVYLRLSQAERERLEREQKR